MDEQIRIILIIIVSVSIFGLLTFVFVRNYIKNKINHLLEEEKDKKLNLIILPLVTVTLRLIELFQKK